jgi:hypothetical protein
MPLPLMSYDWDLKEAEIYNKPIINEEMFYTFEKFKGILTFKISNNNNKGPIGCTSLVNSTFLKSFEKHSTNITSFNSIDIQYDYNFAHPMFIPVADVHGLLSPNVL